MVVLNGDIVSSKKRLSYFCICMIEKEVKIDEQRRRQHECLNTGFSTRKYFGPFYLIKNLLCLAVTGL